VKDENRAIRQAEIEEAAYVLLAEKGYAGTSMLGIAKRAKCSNETLYNWYGNKIGLMREMITGNARAAAELLNDAISTGQPAKKTLQKFGPVLLKILLGDKPILLNRAAAGDSTGELGAELSMMGRETILPLLNETFERSKQDGYLHFKNVNEATELYLGLLIGDLQIRRVIGRIPPLSDQAIKKRAHFALETLEKILANV